MTPFKLFLIPDEGNSIHPQKRFAHADEALAHGTGWAQALSGRGRNYGARIEVVVVDARTNEAVRNEFVDRT